MSGEEEKEKANSPPTATDNTDVEKGATENLTTSTPSTEVETKVETEDETKTEKENETEAEKEKEGETGAETTPEKGAETKAETGDETEAKPKEIDQAKVEKEVEKKGEQEAETKAETERETKPEKVDKKAPVVTKETKPTDSEEASKIVPLEEDHTPAPAPTDGLLGQHSEPNCASNCVDIPPPASASEDCKMANGSFIQSDKDYDKRQSQKQKLLRYIRRKEVVLCTLGGVTFVAGIILIIVAVLTMKNSCESGDDDADDDLVRVGQIPSVSYDHVNLAEGKPAFQSSSEYASDGGFYNASLATDKIHGHTVNVHGCAQTLLEERPYWYVDLGHKELVKKVEIVSGDCCVGELHNFEIRVGDNEDWSENTLCREHLGTALKVAIKIVCDRIIYGRYVSIQILGDEARRNNRLTLCDVLVYSGGH